MIIDDSEMMREFLRTYFSKFCDVSTFSDASEALSELDRQITPDLILLDLNMPNMSGFEFLAQLRNSSLHKDIAVIVLSSADSSEDRIRCLSLGASDYVIKPFNPKELELRARKFLP